MLKRIETIMSMRLRVTLVIMLIVLAITAANYLSSLSFTRKSITDTMEQELSLALDIADTVVATKIGLLKSNAETAAARILGADSDEEINDIMAAQMEEFTDFLSLTIYDRNGFVLNYGEPVNHDVFVTGIDYMHTAFDGVNILSSPHLDGEDGNLVMHVFVPLGDDKVLSATIPGMLFSDILSHYRLWQTGSVFVVDSEGTFVANYRSELVSERRNFVTEAKTNPEMKTAGDFYQGMILDEETGSGRYSFEGNVRFCVYKTVTDTMVGWRIGVAAPLNESPQRQVQIGLLWSAALFLVIGLVISVFVSRFIAKPFSRIEEQNTDIEAKNTELEILNETVRAQAAELQDEYNRAKLMLDATPLACRLMKRLGNGEFELFECNEEAAKLFSFENKQEFMDRYFETYPEFQPDGKRSIEEGQRWFEIAYTEGNYIGDFLLQKPDGTPIPTEVTLVRVKYGNDFVVAGYTRDLREHKKMMEDIEQRDKLLTTGNSTAAILLSADNEISIEGSIVESMALVGRSTDVDRVQIWRNEIIDGELHFVLTHQWVSEFGEQKTPVPIGLNFSYSDMPEWEKLFRSGDCINSPVSQLANEDREFLSTYDMKTIVIIPLFLQGEFWGFFSIDDCRSERVFSEDEISILRSVSLMMINAFVRDAQAAKIREANEYTELLIESMPFACSLWDSDLKMFKCNDGSARMFEIEDKQEFIEHFYDFSPEFQPDGKKSTEQVAFITKKVFEEGALVYEWMHQTRDGTPVPCEVTLVRVAHGSEYIVAAYIRDLREQIKMIDEINRQNEVIGLEKNLNEKLAHWYKSILDAVPFPVTVTDNDMKWVFVNKSVENLLRKKSEDMLGKPCSNWNSDICNTENCGIACVKRGLKRTYFKQFGNSYQVDVDVLKDIDGNTSGFIEVVIDITALQDAVEKMDAALNEARFANKAKSDFLAKMSHEMRTPLNAIIGLSTLSLEDETINDETRLNIEKVSNAGDILLSTVNDILDISKIEAGKLELVPVKYDIPSLLNDTVTQSIMYIGEKPIGFVLDIDDKLPAQLCGDDLRIKQLFNNLLSNAFKYTNEGTVELGVRCERDAEGPETVWMTAWVKDTGIGIKPDNIDSLFGEFVQADTHTNRYVAGTGLGLSITKKMSELMGGSISVESEYGKGSTFTIRIKQGFVTDAHIGSDVVDNLRSFKYSEHKRRRNAKNVRPKLPYANVLVVDDNVTNLDVARGLMKPYCLNRVDCVISGQDAIDAIREEKIKYNAIFMDHMMPEMNGIEATQHIRDIGTDYAKNIPIIACTANAIYGNEQMFLSEGFQAFLSKPIEISRLDDIIKRWVRDKEQEKLYSEQQHEPEGNNEGEALWKSFESASIPGLDIQGGIKRFGGDEESYLNVIRSYANNTVALLDKIRIVGKDELSDYAVIVHGIKGASRGICAEPVGEMAAKLEKASKSGDYGFITENNESFIELTQALITDINNLTGAIDAENPKPKKDAPDRAALLKLTEACYAYNMDDVDAIMKEISAYEYEADDGLADWLESNVAGMNFPTIVKKLTALLDNAQ